jgi:hypothetical protein
MPGEPEERDAVARPMKSTLRRVQSEPERLAAPRDRGPCREQSPRIIVEYEHVVAAVRERAEPEL